ncbi:MAG: TIGR00282 family metallophosphoesterase [Oscillospiraceae bacterium]
MLPIMKILMIGDVVSQIGCDFLRERLPQFKRENSIDIVIANGENSAVGNGILPASANFLLDSGVDVITTGNHVYKRREIYSYLDENPQVIRPANFPDCCNGKGYYLYDGGSYQLLVINLIGVSFMEPVNSPFDVIDDILTQVSAKYVLVDFHAEATGEKKAMGYYLDGKVSAVVGTHTHIQTADDQILPKGTGYITDLGMTGPIDSVLGVCPESIITRFKTHMPTRFEVAEGKCQLNGVILTLDEKKGLCKSIIRINLR